MTDILKAILIGVTVEIVKPYAIYIINFIKKRTGN